MSLHTVTKARDHRWPLFLTDSTRRGRTLHATDEHGQHWQSTAFRRYNSRGWDCGHLEQRMLVTSIDYRQRSITNRRTHYGHSRYWQRTTKRRGIASPVYLCELTATLSPYTGRDDTVLEEAAA